VVQNGGMDQPYANPSALEPPGTGDTTPHAPGGGGSSAQAGGRKYRAIPRTVETCNRYLDRLALVIERAGRKGAVFLPLVERIERELAEAQAEDEALARIRGRLARVKRPRGPGMFGP
jgi:hypothetical protein